MVQGSEAITGSTDLTGNSQTKKKGFWRRFKAALTRSTDVLQLMSSTVQYDDEVRNYQARSMPSAPARKLVDTDSEGHFRAATVKGFENSRRKSMSDEAGMSKSRKVRRSIGFEGFRKKRSPAPEEVCVGGGPDGDRGGGRRQRSEYGTPSPDALAGRRPASVFAHSLPYDSR